MNRTPKKKLLLKPKSEKKSVPNLHPNSKPNLSPTVPDEDRVVVETTASSGLRAPQKTKDQIVRQTKRDVVKQEQQQPPELTYEEQQELYFGRKPSVPVPPPEERVGYDPNPRGSRGRAIFVADDDDDDFLDEDSLVDSHSPHSRKSGRPAQAHEPSQYHGEPIKMGYDDDDEPSAHPKSKASKQSKKSVATESRSRIPKRVVNRQELPASTEAASIALRSVVSMTKDDMDSMMDDLISDVSSQEGRRSKPPRKNHGLNPLQLPERPRADPDPTESLAENPSTPPSHEKRKKKKQVWKMAPIPIKPYIAVAAPADKFKS